MARHRKYNKNKHSFWSSSQFNSLEYSPNEFEDLPMNFPAKSETEGHDRDKDSKGRRIILREVLYEDPDLFYSARDTSGDNKLKRHSKMKDHYGFEWNTQNWKKAGEDEETHKLEYDEIQINHRKINKVEKKLNKMLARPVQTTIAEKMMQKMGWQGGALGKHGEGIIEPIAPNASYATKTLGLGKTVTKAKRKLKEENKEFFDSNVLLHVLHFVRNDLEHEIVFDRHLWKAERKRVHNIIETISGSNNTVSTDFDTVSQMDIAQEILKYNKFILNTESVGAVPNRFLCLYKEAPEHLYLVTPDDLRNEDTDVDNSTKEPKESKENEQKLKDKKGTLSYDTSKPVCENMLLAEVNQENTEETFLAIIVDYFAEFVNDGNYKEFRFVGPFKSKEMDAINIFIAKCTNNDYGENDNKLKVAFNNDLCAIEIKEDCNGSVVFYKFLKNTCEESK